MDLSCSSCGEDYVHVQHPLKPVGVSMQRICACAVVSKRVEGATVVYKRLPTEEERAAFREKYKKAQ